MQYSNRQSQGVYVFRNSTMLYFRQAVPADLRSTFQKTEIRISLRTPDKREAKRKASYLSAKLWDMFLALRKGDTRMTQLSTDQINDLVQEWTEEILSKDEAERALGSPKSIHEPAIKIKGRKAVSKGADITGYESFYIDMAKRALSDGDYSYFEDTVDRLMKSSDITADHDSAAYKLLCREMIKAFIEIHTIQKERSQGNYRPRYAAGQGTQAVVNAAVLPADKRQRSVEKAQQKKLSTALKEYAEEKITHKEWSEATGKQNADKINVFIELIGDIKLCDLTKGKLKEFEKALLNYPRNRNKSPKYRHLPTAEIKKMNIPENERISLQTVAHYINTTNTFLSWLITMYELPSWTSAMLKAPKSDIIKDTRKARAVFDTSDLNKIFSNPWYVTGGLVDNDNVTRANTYKYTSARFWLPLLGLFTGARLEELAQLHLADFKIIDGVKCFELTEAIEDENGEQIKVKSLKNLSSCRIVPLHILAILVCISHRQRHYIYSRYRYN